MKGGWLWRRKNHDKLVTVKSISEGVNGNDKKPKKVYFEIV